MRRVVGDTGLPIFNTLTPIGNPPVQLLAGLTAANVVMMFVDKHDEVNHWTGTGDITIVNDALGIFTYYPSATDLAKTGLYSIFPVVTTLRGPAHYIPQLLEIVDLI